jgi:nascent polypeptide-associated complex subunit alpha
VFRLNPSDLRKQLKKLGIKNVEIKNVDAEEVIIRTVDGEELVAVNPQVVIMEVPGATAMIQVVAASIEKRSRSEAPGEAEVSQEDVEFVAEQAGVSIEEARQALLEAGGDIAAALMLLEERKKAS